MEHICCCNVRSNHPLSGEAPSPGSAVESDSLKPRYVDRPWRRACATQRLDRSEVTEVIYQVCFRGVPSPTLRAAFDDCTVEVDPRGTTVLRCTHEALPLVLTRIQDLGLELVDVAAHDGLDGLDG
jgi:hypothetical protein